MSAPLARTSSGLMAFTVAAVPTGMKAGVRISPRAEAMTPVRAAPSVARSVKLKRVIEGAAIAPQSAEAMGGLMVDMGDLQRRLNPVRERYPHLKWSKQSSIG